MKTGMSTSTLTKMSNNENVSMEIILRICEILECNVGDVMDATKKED
jgi:DNA-binding Xre family transcriptional regulator